MTGFSRRPALLLAAVSLVACGPAPSPIPRTISSFIARDYHLVTTGLEPLDSVTFPAGSRELRLWPVGWDRRRLFRAVQTPETGTVLYRWAGAPLP